MADLWRFFCRFLLFTDPTVVLRLMSAWLPSPISDLRFEHSHPAFLSLQRGSVMKNIQKTPNFKVLSDFEFLEASGAARAGR